MEAKKKKKKFLPEKEMCPQCILAKKKNGYLINCGIIIACTRYSSEYDFCLIRHYSNQELVFHGRSSIWLELYQLICLIKSYCWWTTASS